MDWRRRIADPAPTVVSFSGTTVTSTARPDFEEVACHRASLPDNPLGSNHQGSGLGATRSSDPSLRATQPVLPPRRGLASIGLSRQALR